jgi:hypothetical protein
MVRADLITLHVEEMPTFPRTEEQATTSQATSLQSQTSDSSLQTHGFPIHHADLPHSYIGFVVMQIRRRVRPPLRNS